MQPSFNSDLSPKPAYYAYQFAQQELGGAVFMRRITGYPQVMGYEFQVSGRTLWVLWSLDGQPHSVGLPALPRAINNIGSDGNPVPNPISQTLYINLFPFFIEY